MVLDRLGKIGRASGARRLVGCEENRGAARRLTGSQVRVVWMQKL